MVLKMEYSYEEAVYPEAYISISCIVISKDQVNICTNYFANLEDYQASGLPLTQPAFTTDVSIFSSGQISEGAYNYLLTLPEFASAQLLDL